MTYSEKLKDPRWQKKRLEVLNRDGWKCRCCEETKKTLQVHHRYYVSGRDPWNYPGWCFMTLCDKCHDEYEEGFKEWHEWEISLDTLFADSDGDVLLAGEFKYALAKSRITSASLLTAISVALGSGGSLADEIEKQRQWEAIWGHNG